MSNAGQPKVIRTVYTGAPKGQTYDAWREDVCQNYCRLVVEPSDGEAINCGVEIATFSSVAVGTASGTSAQFSRTRDLLSDACDALALVTASSGDVLVTQNGRPIELQQSQMCLIDLSMPCSVDLNPKNLFTAVRLPRRDLLSVCPQAESKLIERLGDNAALRETIASYSALASAMAGRLDIGGQQLTAQHLVDLIGLLLGAGPHEKELAIERGLSAAQLNLIQAETLKNLSDDTLTVVVVARRCGVSPRHVQRLFERAGTTFTEFVLEHRLRLARRLLFSPGNRYGKIGSIAYDAGFSDISYFNRVFRKRFGATPSELRNSGTRSTGVENTAAGFGALESNTGGFGTTATGANALVR